MKKSIVKKLLKQIRGRIDDIDEELADEEKPGDNVSEDDYLKFTAERKLLAGAEEILAQSESMEMVISITCRIPEKWSEDDVRTSIEEVFDGMGIKYSDFIIEDKE